MELRQWQRLAPTATFVLPLMLSASSSPTSQKKMCNRCTAAKVCKSCHERSEAGGIHKKWKTRPHAGAYDTFATPAAKKLAAKVRLKPADLLSPR